MSSYRTKVIGLSLHSRLLLCGGFPVNGLTYTIPRPLRLQVPRCSDIEHFLHGPQPSSSIFLFLSERCNDGVCRRQIRTELKFSSYQTSAKKKLKIKISDMKKI